MTNNFIQLGSALQANIHLSNQTFSTFYGSRKSITPFGAALEWPKYDPEHLISYFYSTVYQSGFSLPHTATFNCILRQQFNAYQSTLCMVPNLIFLPPFLDKFFSSLHIADTSIFLDKVFRTFSIYIRYTY